MNRPILESELLPDDREFDRMRLNLFERIDEAESQSIPHLVRAGSKRKKPRRRVAWITATGLAAVALTVVLVAGNVFGPRATTAEAAEVLHSAAVASIESSDPVVGPGQFLKVDTTEVALGYGRSPSGEAGAYEQPQTITLYIPHNTADMWVIARQQLKPGKSYGDAQWQIKDFWHNPKRGDRQLYQALGGTFTGGQSFNPADAIAKLPRDSATLFTYLYDHADGSASKDEAVWTSIVDLLRTGLVPAALRSAMYEVLARVPGVYLSEGKANLNGTTGLAISRKEPSRPFVAQIIIDPATGLFIGERDIVTNADSVVPVGASQDWTAVTTTVVDDAPAGPYDVMPPQG